MAENLLKAASALTNKQQYSIADAAGKNNANAAGIIRTVDRLNQLSPITEDSVFADMGSGYGLVCLYVAYRFGCKVIGYERGDQSSNAVGPDIYQRAVQLMDDKGLQRQYKGLRRASRRISYFRRDVLALDAVDLYKAGVTHIYSFDGVFEPKAAGYLYSELIGKTDKSIVGTGTGRQARFWRGLASFEQLPGQERISTQGGGSRFTMYFYRYNGLSDKEDTTVTDIPSREEEKEKEESLSVIDLVSGSDEEEEEKEKKTKRQKTQCMVCYKHTSNSMACGRCMQRVYCSAECQRLDWDSGHKAECQ